MITRVQVKNYRCFEHVDVQLGPLTVLVGRNGVGKSAFLDVLRFVRDALGTSLEVAIDSRHGIGAIRRWSAGRPRNIEITLAVETPRLWGEYSFVLTSTQGTYRRGREVCRSGKVGNAPEDEFEIKDNEWKILPQSLRESTDRLDKLAESHELLLPKMSIFSEFFGRLRRDLMGSFYNILPETIRRPQKPSGEKHLMDGGENFASIVRRLHKNQRSRFSSLLKAVGRVVGGITDLRVRSVGGYLVTELKHEDLGEFGSEDRTVWFELDQESDGTLRLLGMLVALYQNLPPGRLIALEEPENSLHPGALAVLSDVVAEASSLHQVIITTQSPDLISRFNINELQVVDRAEGVSQIGPISEMQREAVEEQLFTTGDLMRIEGLRRDNHSRAFPAGGAGV